jgi:hypothetical protein
LTGFPAGFEDILSDIMGGDFAAPDNENHSVRQRDAVKHEQARQQAERLALAHTMYRAFATDDGRAALKILTKMTLLRPEAPEELSASGDRYQILKAERAGQNQLVFKIFELLRVAQGGEGLSANGGDHEQAL